MLFDAAFFFRAGRAIEAQKGHGSSRVRPVGEGEGRAGQERGQVGRCGIRRWPTVRRTGGREGVLVCFCQRRLRLLVFIVVTPYLRHTLTFTPSGVEEGVFKSSAVTSRSQFSLRRSKGEAHALSRVTISEAPPRLGLPSSEI